MTPQKEKTSSSSSSPNDVSLISVIPGVYYLPISKNKQENVIQTNEMIRLHFKQSDFVPVLDADVAVKYVGFDRSDFGPHSLAHTLQFAACIDAAVKSYERIIVVSGPSVYAANAITMLSIYRMLRLKIPASEAFAPFAEMSNNVPAFIDCGFPPFTFPLTSLDVLNGLQKGMELKLLGNNIEEDLDTNEILYDNSIPGGEMSWIFPKKIVALVSPGILRSNPPATYLDRFRKHNVKVVIRLSRGFYENKEFLEIPVVDMQFGDGSNPSMEILESFLNLASKHIDRGEAIAVHCHAGLGRTGTLIGAWAMREWGFTTREVIGFMRLQRPGCVIGDQQHFLQSIEGKMHEARKFGMKNNIVLPKTGGGNNGKSSLLQSHVADPNQGMELTQGMMKKSTSVMTSKTIAQMTAQALRKVPWRKALL